MRPISEAVQVGRDPAGRTRQIALDFTSARLSGNFERVRQLLHPDAVAKMPANMRTAQFAGECRGRDAILRLFREIDACLEVIEAEVFDVIVEGDRAVVRWRTTQRNRGSGASLRVEGCVLVAHVDGLIVELVRYSDTATIAALARQ